jgi:drug/metabolite transporter (DMT)-like permease
MEGADLARLGLLAALWGASFIFMRILAPVLGPLFTALSRVTIAGIVLVAYFRLAGFDTEVARHWRRYALIGIVNSAIPFTLFAYAALHLPASYSAILNATSPFFVLLLSALVFDEALTGARLLGLVLGLGGVGLVSGAGPVSVDADFLFAVCACIAAAFCYAANGIYIRRWASDLAPRAIAGWSQLFAGLALLPVVLLAPLPPATAFTPTIVANIAGFALLCSALAYLLYFRLIADVGPARAMTVTFLLPLFGMLWGVLILGETVTGPMLAGCALVLAGTGLVLRPTSGKITIKTND